MPEAPDDSSVKVAVRIRPQNAKERIEMNQICTSVPAGDPQIFVGKDKAFTFDYVFNMNSKQEEIMTTLAKPLIDGCLEGYNATLFAYGQTGSGKTYTMGTAFDVNGKNEEVGIIPRAVQYLFGCMEERKSEAAAKNLPMPEFKVMAQFIELYNEELHDLLNITQESRSMKSHIKIHEDAQGSIYITGVSTRVVSCLEDTMKCLKDGALCRSTASTNMNSQSSRSHAIFTLHIRQQRLVVEEEEESLEEGKEIDTAEQVTEFETLTAKFHFVDLAGSERLKRTGATGDRAKEGISINCGLLALGNVISALGDRTKRGSHVPYRDSKLTRLLQDSLGGNSQTIMIACVSPSDCDFMETLNALKYANRARNILNKVSVNQDKTSKQLAALRIQIQGLQEELMEYRQGKRVAGNEGEGYSDVFVENNFLQSENTKLRTRVKALNSTIDSMKVRNAQLLAEREMSVWHRSKSESAAGGDDDGEVNGDGEIDEVMRVVEKYTAEVEELRAKLAEAEATVNVLQRSVSTHGGTGGSFSSPAGGRVSMGTSEFPLDIMTESLYGDYPLSPPPSGFSSRTASVSAGTKRTGRRRKKESETVGGMEDEEEEGEEGINEGNDGDVEDMASGEEEELDEIASDSESEENEVDVENNLHQSLAALSSEIDVKKRLIDELQSKQRQLRQIRDHYERQMETLSVKIRETETERDTVLVNLGKVEHSSEERVRKVREEFERKLALMQDELRKVNAAKREHATLLRNQARKEQELRQLHRDLEDLKRMKVEFSKKLRDETRRTREVETTHSRQIAQLRKEKRQADNQIRNLEHEKTQRERVLRRKQEEVEALRKRNSTRGVVSSASSRPGSQSSISSRPGSVSLSNVAKATVPTRPSLRQRRDSNLARLAKAKWDSMERTLVHTVNRKQTIARFERDMNTWVKEREKMGKRLETLRARAKKLADEKKDTAELEFEINNLSAQIEAAQDSIQECQTAILELEEAKPEANVVPRCTLDEAYYLMEHLYEVAIGKGLLAQQKETEERDLRAQLETKCQERDQALEMLQIALHNANFPFDVDEIFHARSDEDEESSSSDPAGGEIMMPSKAPERPLSLSSSNEDGTETKKTLKARRKTATPEELLGVGSGGTSMATTPMEPLHESAWEMPDRMTMSMDDAQLMPPPTRGLTMPRNRVQPSGDTNSNHVGGHMQSKIPQPGSAGPSPAMRRKQYGGGRQQGPGMTNSLIVPSRHGDSASEVTPPTSPTLGLRRANSARSTDGNVFNRLTSQTNRSSPNPMKGNIYPINKQATRTNLKAPLECTHVAEGHTKAVLDIDVTNTVMVTGSKDRTAKIWDLATMQEISTLGDHPNNVTKVRYSEQTHLVYTVCSYFIKIWDDRVADKCIKTLLSSGLSQDDPPEVSQSLRQNICPPGQTNIMDLVINSAGTVMFLATANSVKLWDLRRFCAVGKLHGNHQAPVMVLAMDDSTVDNGGTTTVVTGSKDHYIKIFSVGSGSCGLLTPVSDLQPPHYDGIEALALRGNVLFSGSRDAGLKKWDLDQARQDISIIQAHKDWIQGLCLTGDGLNLLSGCRGGVLKLWNVEDCAYLGEVQAHNAAINAVRTNGDKVFTVSNDNSIRFWRLVNDGEEREIIV